jgi:transcriptional regulator with XRE-family HTH domain
VSLVTRVNSHIPVTVVADVTSGTLPDVGDTPEPKKKPRDPRLARRGADAAAKFSEIIKARGLKEPELADAIGVDRSHINRLKNAKRATSIGLAALLADELEVSLDYVIGRKVPADNHKRSFDVDDSKGLKRAIEQAEDDGRPFPIAVLAAGRRAGLELDEAGWSRFLRRLEKDYEAAVKEARRGSGEHLSPHHLRR